MTHDKQKTLIGLKKARTLLDTVIKMVEADAYCIDIMQQNLAVVGLLRAAHQKLMENHLHHCFASAVEAGTPKKKQAMMEEILTVTNLFNK